MLAFSPNGCERERGGDEREELVDDASNAQACVRIVEYIKDVANFDDKLAFRSTGNDHILVVFDLWLDDVRVAVELEHHFGDFNLIVVSIVDRVVLVKVEYHADYCVVVVRYVAHVVGS